MVNINENKKLDKDALDMQKYRNDWKFGREHELIPEVDYPAWMKPKGM